MLWVDRRDLWRTVTDITVSAPAWTTRMAHDTTGQHSSQFIITLRRPPSRLAAADPSDTPLVLPAARRVPDATAAPSGMSVSPRGESWEGHRLSSHVLCSSPATFSICCSVVETKCRRAIKRV